MENNDLINCYCTYKWNYKSLDEMWEKWEEDYWGWGG